MSFWIFQKTNENFDKSSLESKKWSNHNYNDVDVNYVQIISNIIRKCHYFLIWQLFIFYGRNLSNFALFFLEHLRLSKRHSEIKWPLLPTFPPGRDTFLSPSQSLGEQGLTFSFFLYLQHAQCTYSHYPLCIEVHSRVHKSRYSPNTVIQCVRLAPFFILAVLFWTGLVRGHPYITSAKGLVGWV